MADQTERARTAGEALRNAEQGLGTVIKNIVDDYYSSNDSGTARAIRTAETEALAAEIVGQMRRGRLWEVVLLASSGVLGVAGGILLQRLMDVRIAGVPPLAAAGVLPAVLAALSNHSLPIRSTVAVGGASFATGTYLYTLARAQGGTP